MLPLDEHVPIAISGAGGAEHFSGCTLGGGFEVLFGPFLELAFLLNMQCLPLKLAPKVNFPS